MSDTYLPILVNRYVITDCLGNVAGKPKGYKSMGTALGVANNRKTSVYSQIKKAFDSLCPDSNLKLIYRVECCQYDIEELQ